jgi:2-polyprenyl-3-methyl-5-hydroxy-6-metoxy-1,4-benzoquinol methylase
MSLSLKSDRFEQLARLWESEPQRQQRAWDLARILHQHLPMTPATRLMDYGCGSGLVSVALHEEVGEIVAVDISAEILAVLREKLAAAGITSIRTRQADWQVDEVGAERFDVIISTMAMHHIRDLGRLMERLVEALTPGGWVGIMDLDEGAESFHGPSAAVEHHGLSGPNLKKLMIAAGLQQVKVEVAYHLHRSDSDGEKREYGLLLATGQKPD